MAAVLFTVAVLAVFIGAIVYTAYCARAAVAAEYALPDDDAISQDVVVARVGSAAAATTISDVDVARTAA